MKGFSKYANVGGGEDPKPLSPQQLQDWNRYVDWLESKGMKGSTELDKGETSFKWLADYQRENPQTTISKETIKSVQYEMQKLADNVRNFERRRNNNNAEKLMQGTSKLDGIPGSKTTSFKFPVMVENNYHNNSLVSTRNLGLVNGDGNPSSMPPAMSSVRNKIPKGAKLERLQDGVYYEDPQSGDLVKVSD